MDDTHGSLRIESIDPAIYSLAVADIDMGQIDRRIAAEPLGQASELVLLNQGYRIGLVDGVVKQQREHVFQLVNAADTGVFQLDAQRAQLRCQLVEATA